ncbi:uncharacterized protein LOC122300642 [Carya illinoinensis]|uniref:Uncharacterized protein n=1 Tax=Carya illinoinensis TaxID=32201 RepID=A0A8T1RCN6_CARIL|nr:uncharacterized protein LOC122300642 [Carya illinoinensis]XP_042967386.1 uncharacterized protein LOC122300642 [Carya illinoinensis]XP_042967387.1 uncharacterized protein LOC122300642 [Carya illinoinensis]KAG6664635.1 hypothetical protein CIPAW_02G107600 [Carya illinoinensis]KAG6664636.1 hypothetical protein CIPAW_02G107600 [Carya illinoinensis]
MCFSSLDRRMDHTFVNACEDGWGKERSMHILGNDSELSREDGLDFSQSKSKRLVKRVNSGHAIILKFKQSQLCRSCNRGTFGLDSRIPKHLVSVDEKYLRRCLELININASKVARCNASNQAKIRSKDAYDAPSFIYECPLESGNGGVVVSPAGRWIVGTIMGSKSMQNILKSPLFHQFGSLDGNANFRRSNLNDIKGSICYDIMDSPSGLTISSPQKPKKKIPLMGSHNNGSDSEHKRGFSMSSANSIGSDQSSSSPSPSPSAFVSQGMLHCTWKGGLPHFVFSTDDQREVYVANLWKVGSTDDYIYSFYSIKDGQKDHGVCDNLVGHMKVSASLTHCLDNSKIREIEFVLYGGDENCGIEANTSSLNPRKNKGFPRKVVQVFRTSRSSKHKTLSKSGGSSTIPEKCSLELCDTGNNLETLGMDSKFENHFLPKFELAAIVVKNYVHDNHREGIGGWGLKFLRKFRSGKNVDSLEASVPCGSSSRNTGICSTTMDILIPAGLHGGPGTKNCGPSSLRERWRSGGHCDCGGWDIGCPLTILESRLSKDSILPEVETQEECKPFDLFKQGSQHPSPTLRMVNVHDGLYFVHFQPILSALQSFSIAVAIIHTRSPSLQPKYVQD